MAGNFFRGTTVDQDGRWGKADEKLMAKMQKAGKFASILGTKIDIKKVNIDIISKWISEKTIEILGFEDEIVIHLVINMLQSDNLHGKKLQLDVTGFLEKKAGTFVEELWTLLVDAQSQPNGIPEAFIRKKKEEILRRQQAIQKVTNAALQQSSLENDTKDGRWGPHSSAPTLSKDEIHFSDNIQDGRKSEQVCKDSENDNMGFNLRDPESNNSTECREKEDGLKEGNQGAGGGNRYAGEERDRSKSHDRRDRDSDHRKHRSRHRDSSRDGGRDRKRSRERDSDRYHRRDSDRSRERSRRSRKDDRSDRSDRKSDRYDRKSEDRNDKHKSHRRERSHSEDRHRSDRKSSHRRDDVRDRRKEHRGSRRDDNEKVGGEDTVNTDQKHNVDIAGSVEVKENEDLSQM